MALLQKFYAYHKSNDIDCQDELWQENGKKLDKKDRGK